MKKIYLYAMALGLMFASCEDFLTEYPKNKITPDDFFKTEREISLYANSFYEKNRHKAQRKAKFYINKCRSASCMQSGRKRTPA